MALFGSHLTNKGIVLHPSLSSDFEDRHFNRIATYVSPIVRALILRSLPRICILHQREHACNAIMTSNSLHLSLPFDPRYFSFVCSLSSFMTVTEIMDWIDSVSPFLQDWYDQCLTKPENEHHIKGVMKGVKDNLNDAVREIMVETDQQHYNARLAGKLVFCPSHELLQARACLTSNCILLPLRVWLLAMGFAAES